MGAGDYSQFVSDSLPWDKLGGANILVTGANGLIASNLVEALLQLNEQLSLGCSVYALSRSAEKARARFGRYLEDDNFFIIEGDVSESLALNLDFQFIIHAASSACPEAFNHSPVDVMKANCIGTLNLLDRYCRNSDTRFLFVSSSEVYGENETGKPLFTEQDFGSVNFARFRACYPESKRASETLCMSYRQQYGSDVIVVRPSYIFGREINDSNTRADVYFARQVLNGEDIVMNSHGVQVRSYLYVKDCVMGVLYALIKGVSGEVYNIGDANCVVTLREYAQLLADVGGVTLRFEIGSAPSDTVFLKTSRCVLDASKLKGLGWKIRYSLRDGIVDMLE